MEQLVCTAFLLPLCVTGLPLIFGEEIAHATGAEPELAPPPVNATPVNLDTIPPDKAYIGSHHPRGFDSRYFGLVPISTLRRMERIL